MTQLPLTPELGKMRESIELDSLVEEMRQLLADDSNPWTLTNKNDGRNWLLASFGQSDDNRQWYLTTDSVRVSEYSGDAESNVRFCVLARKLMPRLLERLK